MYNFYSVNKQLNQNYTHNSFFEQTLLKLCVHKT